MSSIVTLLGMAMNASPLLKNIRYKVMAKMAEYQSNLGQRASIIHASIFRLQN